MLKRARLFNVCQHEDRVLETGPGLTIVVGPQGSGKTNLLSMAIATLSGDNPLPGVKKANIREGAEKQPSFTTAEWQFGDKVIQVTRGFNAKAKSNLVINGESLTSVRREAEITSRIMSEIGLNKDSVWKYSFVSQGDTDGILNVGAADRVRFMASLLGMSEILTWQSKASDALKKAEEMLEADYRQEYRNRYVDGRTWRSRLEEAKQEAVEISGARDKYLAYAKQYGDVSATIRERSSLESSYSQKMNRHKEIVETIRTLTEQVAKSKQKISELSAWVEKYEQADKIQANNAQRQQAQQTVAGAERAIAESKALLADIPSKPTVAKSSMDDYSAAKTEYVRVEKELKLVLEGKSSCDKCGAPVDITAERRSQLESELQRITVEGQAMQQSIKAWSDYDVQMAAYNSRVPLCEQRIAQSEELLKSSREVLESLPEMQELPQWYMKDSQGGKRCVQAIQDCRNQVSNAEGRDSQLRSEEASLRQELGGMREHYEKLVASLKGVDTEAVVRAWSEVDRLNEELTMQESQISQLRSQIHTNRDRMRDLAASYKRQRRAVLAKEGLSELTKSLAVKELPRSMLYRRMQGLGVQMSDLCAELNQPYRITIGEDLDFMVEHPSGRVESCQRLSGGQRACVATVFWLVRLLSNVGRNLPVLVLDEPSAHMDPNGVVGQLGDMLSRLNPILVRNNLQVFVVTHHRQLLGCGQYVCDLEAV